MSKRKTRKRVVVLADLHCGHRVGLTPPKWWKAEAATKWVATQRACWQWYVDTLEYLTPVNVLVVNADCIDGRGERSGGTELIEPDRNRQLAMAVDCINHAEAKRIVMTRGTPYHTGEAEDFEDIIATQLDASIGDHEWYDINGVVLDVKHAIGNSSIPHGRYTPLGRADLWNSLWSERDLQPRADIIIRSHVHAHNYIGGMRNGKPWLAMTTPALQGMGTKFGARKCEGLVDFGLVQIDIEPDGGWTWQAHIANLPSQKAHALTL